MSKVFIGGSRFIRSLDERITARLDRIASGGSTVLIGDAPGADAAVQRFLANKHYADVTVFCAGDGCRNNIGSWQMHRIAANGAKRDARFYTAKDAAMADEATEGLFIWDGDSVGTIVDACMLANLGKPVELYLAGTGEFRLFVSQGDWSRFFSGLADDLRKTVIGRLQWFESSVSPSTQLSLL
jgi:adenine-specific DNA-methyltransferase